MSDQAELADDASENGQRFLTWQDGRKDGGDIDLFRWSSVGQNDLPVGAGARLYGRGLFFAGRRSSVCAVFATTRVSRHRSFPLGDTARAEHAAPAWWQDQKDAGSPDNR